MQNAKVVILGDGGVGKTALVNQWAHQKFENRYIATIGVDIISHTVEINEGKKLRIDAWDLAGQVHFRNIRTKFYRQAAGAILVFDITSRPSFDNNKNWLTEVETALVYKIPIILIGNKIDLADLRLISPEEGISQADSLGLLYLETSALSGIGVPETFSQLAKLILNQN